MFNIVLALFAIGQLPVSIQKVSPQMSGMTEVLNLLNFGEILKNVDDNSTGNELCSNHSNLLFSSLQSKMWAMKMFDASTKIPESVLTGLMTHLGNFDECLAVQNVETEFGSFNGQYCLASVNLPLNMIAAIGNKVSDIQMRQNAIMPIGNQSRNARAGVGSVPGMGLTLAYCIPSTCSAQDFQNIVNKLLSKLPSSMNISINIADGMCQSAQQVHLAVEDWVTISVLIIISIFSILSTTYDLLTREPKSKLLTAFSWYSNGKKLLSIGTSEETFEAIHGIRFLSMCWVVMGHRYMTNVSVPSINLLDVADMIPDFWRLYLTNATLSVDSFFLLSGLLVSYLFLKEMMKEKKTFNYPLYAIHRYIRLTPPYAMMILFHATLLRYLSSGPLLKTTVEQNAKLCQENWWTNLLYVNNYIINDGICVAQSWYLAVDMQLFILSPIILIPLWKLPRKWSLSLLGALIFGGLITAFTVSFVEKLPPTMITANATDFMELQYYPTYTRFTPWLIGVGFGYLFHETKTKKWNISKVKILLGWCIASVALLGSFLGIYSFYKDFSLETFPDNDPKDDLSAFEASIYTALSRSSWALGVGWIAYACVFGFGGPINTFLSWKLFQPLSRLTYCIYLVHVTYQTIQTLSARTPSYYSDLNTIPAFVSDVVICTLLAAVLSLSVESPMIVLERCILGKGKPRSNDRMPLAEAERVNEETEGASNPVLENVEVHTSNITT